MRACRPSRYSQFDKTDEEELAEEAVRQSMVRVYAQKVRAGLPLFDGRQVIESEQTAK